MPNLIKNVINPPIANSLALFILYFTFSIRGNEATSRDLHVVTISSNQISWRLAQKKKAKVSPPHIILHVSSATWRQIISRYG